MNKNKKDIMEKIFKLADFIDYQKGAVVSHTIINKKAGTVTLFSFDREQGLSEHVVPFDALVYIVSGKAKVFIAGKPHYLNKGEFIIMPANKSHSLKAIEKFRMLLVMVKK
ncbi:MAG: cupin domain-containing protein [Candidatus Omnitrophota bacterium]|nr:cupin domain-containing protein [Candidatus Omnitrophota bacterium]